MRGIALALTYELPLHPTPFPAFTRDLGVVDNVGVLLLALAPTLMLVRTENTAIGTENVNRLKIARFIGFRLGCRKKFGISAEGTR